MGHQAARQTTIHGSKPESTPIGVSPMNLGSQGGSDPIGCKAGVSPAPSRSRWPFAGTRGVRLRFVFVSQRQGVSKNKDETQACESHELRIRTCSSVG